MFNLLCYVRDDDYKQAFKVEIEEGEAVATLKEVIKEKKRPHFDHILADSLVLWKVSLPYDRNLAENAKNLSLVDGLSQVSVTDPSLNNEQIQSMSPLQKLSNIFSELPMEEHVHIIVKPPPARSTPTEDGQEEDGIIAAMKRNHNEILRRSGDPSPSELAGSKEYEICGQPSPSGTGNPDELDDARAPPIQLFHPVFGHFLDDLSSDLPVPREILRETASYARSASAIYDTGATHRAVLDQILGRILGIQNIDKTPPGSMLLVTLAGSIHELIIPLLRADKNELGSKGCDPWTGSPIVRFWAQDKYSFLRNSTCCPTFLLATAGPWLTIVGAVFTDRWIIQRLTDFIYAGINSTLNDSQNDRVAHIMYSLRRNMAKLQEYYAGLNVTATSPDDPHPRLFPSIRAYRNEEGRIVEFKYTKPLNLDSTCVTFLAKTTTRTPKQVIVKFVERYGAEAHRLLAKDNLAPQLLYHGKVGVLEGDPSYGHLRMVVIEYVDGETFDKATRIPPTWVDQVRRALNVLHHHGYVFGDLRQPNIIATGIATGDDEVKLIDFGWAGIHQKSRYPLLASPNLDWPDGVEPFSIMETWHDDDMLGRLIQAKQSVQA